MLHTLSVTVEELFDPQRRALDLSRLDFDRLRKKFDEGRKRIETEKLRAAVGRKLQTLVPLNRMRADYLGRFQEMIEEYNAGAINVEVLFDRLVQFAQELTEEEQRAISERLTEEELAIFDLLTKPDMKLSDKEQRQVKKIARDLLATLKREKLVLDWRKRQQSRAAVRLAIEETLEHLPRCYTPEIFQRKCDAVYQHVFDSYYGGSKSVYAMSA